MNDNCLEFNEVLENVFVCRLLRLFLEFVLLNYPPSNSFYQICQMQDRRNGKIFRDEEQSVPYYVTGNTWVGYDDIYSVKNKVSSS